MAPPKPKPFDWAQLGYNVAPYAADAASNIAQEDPYAVDWSDAWAVGADVGRGALTGATLGSMVPFVGTAIGTGVGALYGLGKGLYEERAEGQALRQADQQGQAQETAIDKIRQRADYQSEQRRQAGRNLANEMSNRRVGMNRGISGRAVQDVALRGRENIMSQTESDVAGIQTQADMAVAQMMRDDERLDRVQAQQRYQNMYNAIGPAAGQLVKYIADSRRDSEASPEAQLYAKLLERVVAGYDQPGTTTSGQVANPATATGGRLSSLMGDYGGGPPSPFADKNSGMFATGDLASAPAKPAAAATDPMRDKVTQLQGRAEGYAADMVTAEQDRLLQPFDDRRQSTVSSVEDIPSGWTPPSSSFEDRRPSMVSSVEDIPSGPLTPAQQAIGRPPKLPSLEKEYLNAVSIGTRPVETTSNLSDTVEISSLPSRNAIGDLKKRLPSPSGTRNDLDRFLEDQVKRRVPDPSGPPSLEVTEPEAISQIREQAATAPPLSRIPRVSNPLAAVSAQGGATPQSATTTPQFTLRNRVKYHANIDFSRSTDNRVRKYDSIIEATAKKYNLPADLIRAIIYVESSGQTDAISGKKAVGLMQLSEAAAKDVGVRNRYDPQENIEGGTEYLSRLLKQYDNNLEHALAAYNWGMGNLDEALKSGQAWPQETSEYLPKVINLYLRYQKKGKKGAK